MKKVNIFNALTCAWLFIILSGCATAPPPAQNQTLSWNNRTQTLTQIQSWHLQGAIGVRTTQDSVSGDLNWRQQQQNYTISLYGPLGSNSFILTGQPGKVELAMANGKKIIAHDPETLLAEQVHWHLPVSSLHYWIRGLPVPNIPAEKQFDPYHHLEVLQQQGWNIQYLRYSAFNGVDLPTKILLVNPDLSVKIVISGWQWSS